MSKDFIVKEADFDAAKESGRIDCNFCKNINLTESEQNSVKKNLKLIPDHVCLNYKKRVIHRASNKNHCSHIYPCLECENDNFINFKRRR